MTTRTLLLTATLFALVFGFCYRLFPILVSDDAVARFFITEDGYLMLTVARNIALGLGLSVSDGTIPTNGVQPLATFLYTLPYLATGGEKHTSLVGILLISTLISVAAAGMLRLFARAALTPQSTDPVWPLLVAALWFAGPTALFHTMNGLETGLYTLMVVTTACYFGHLLARGGQFSWTGRIVLGALCGLVFLARIDGAFFVTALLLTRFITTQLRGEQTLREALAEGIPAGLMSLLIAAPWLVNNMMLFGSPMPISGYAQSLNATFGSNLGAAPFRFFETLFPMLPLPRKLESWAWLGVVLGLLSLAVLAAFLRQAWRRGGVFLPVLIAYGAYAVMILVYYALFFGAEHFLARYFAPLAPLCITALVSVGLDLARALPRGPVLLRAAGVLALVLSLGLITRLALPGGKTHGHFQVVEWIETHVPDATWVGAVQTGTLGYWHDRTINLDGKVNPDALAARMEAGDVLGYVVESPIDYLADWIGIAGWASQDKGGFRDTFELIEKDPARNLAVLRRRAPG